MGKAPLMNQPFRRYVGPFLWSALLLAVVGCTSMTGQAKPSASQKNSKVALIPAQQRPDSLPTIVDPPSSSELEHDTSAFTQGLLFHNGSLYESTGHKGRSKVRKLDPENGAVRQEVPLSDDHFGEGLAFLEGSFYQLTWTSGVCLVYDQELKFQKQLLYGTEGWGLTVHPEEKLLVFSDGSSEIRLVDPTNFITKRKFTVTDGNGEPVYRLNELEWVRGELWANVWMSDVVCRIDPSNGQVVGWIKFGRLVQENQTGDDDVLNGLAYDSESDTLWITGKLWPKIYRFPKVAETFFSAPTTRPDTPQNDSPSPAH